MDYEKAVYQLARACDDGTRLVVSFSRVGDRFTHAIAHRRSDGSLIANWDSMQQTDETTWPWSPPIQELSLESFDSRPVLLGVGRWGTPSWGTGHWSMSVETSPLGQPPAIWFDIACRCPSRPAWLGSTYRAEPARVLPDGLHALVLSSDTITEDCRLDTCAGESQGWSVKCEANPDKWPATLRWRYRALWARAIADMD